MRASAEASDPGRVAVDSWGEGEPLVLIHGLAATRQVWDDVTAGLAAKRRVITLDVPGFGQSEPAGDGFDLEEVARQIGHALAANGVLGRFDLVGHSLGAGVAVALAVAEPHSVRRLVLVAPAGFSRMPWPASVMAGAAATQMLAMRRALAPLSDLSWGRRLLLAFAAADGASIPPTQARMIINSSASARRTAAALATITTTDLAPLLAGVPAPLGLIWGEEDRTVPARLAEVVLKARPDAAIERIARAGHLVMIEQPDAFVAALQRLLEQLDKDQAARRARPSTLV